jgi:hypothetical protein
MNRDVRAIYGVAGVTMAVGILITGCASIPDRAESEPEFVDIGGIETNVDVDTRAELDAFLSSDAPKTIYLNESGESSKVAEGNQRADSRLAESSPCQAHDLCLPGR